MKHKKVELTELFYDLVYVYAISQITSLIHHVHHGVVTPYAFFTFAMGLIIYVNSWMVQTVYTNRFGKNSIGNILSMFAQMVCLLVSSTAITENWSAGFIWFILPMALISLILLLQYVASYYQTGSLANRALIKRFFGILSIRTLVLLVSAFLSYRIGLPLAAVGILATWIMPGIVTRTPHPQEQPINFPHLIERLSLLVIITFGEMIIGIAPYFTPERLSVASLLAFWIVSNLFMIYIVEIDHCIDDELTGVTGNRAIYAHYPIFAGLSFVTVSLGFLSNQEASTSFAYGLFLVGLVLFMLGVYLHTTFNKVSHRFNQSLILGQCAALVIGGLLGYLVIGTWEQVMIVIALFTTVMMVQMVAFNLKHLKENQ